MSDTTLELMKELHRVEAELKLNIEMRIKPLYEKIKALHEQEHPVERFEIEGYKFTLTWHPHGNNRYQGHLGCDGYRWFRSVFGTEKTQCRELALTFMHEFAESINKGKSGR